MDKKEDSPSSQPIHRCPGNEEISLNHENIKTFQDLWRLLEEGQRTLNLKDTASESVFLIGKTRSGKSTLRLLLCNRDNLEALQAVGFRPRINDGGRGELGNEEGFSCTQVPKIFRVPCQTRVTWVDTPGVGDNRGPFQEIVGMHLLNQVASQAKNIKILLVIPYDAFDESGNREERLQPFRFAMQIVCHLSSVESVRVVVTKVESNTPLLDNNLVTQQIFAMLKLMRHSEHQKLNAGQESTELNAFSVLQNVIEKKRLFVVRRPYPQSSKVVAPLNKIVCDANDPRSAPYFQVVSTELVRFCEKLEYAKLLSNFTVIPSAETKIRLTEMFTDVNKQLEMVVSHLLDELWENVVILREKVYGDNGEYMQLLSECLEALTNFLGPKPTVQVSSNYDDSALVLQRLSQILETDRNATHIRIFTETRQELRYVQDITSVDLVNLEAATEALFLRFHNKLDGAYRTLLDRHKGKLQLKLRNQIIHQVDIIKEKYRERFDYWSDNLAHHDLALGKLDCHYQLLKEGTDADATTPEEACRFLYTTLSLVTNDSVEKDLRQLRLLYGPHGELLKLVHYMKPEDEPRQALVLFLQELKSTAVKAEVQAGNIKELQDMIHTFRENILMAEFYADLSIDTITQKVKFLKIVKSGLGRFLGKYSKNEESSIVPDVAEEINSFCGTMAGVLSNNMGGLLGQLKCADVGQVYFPYWKVGILSLQDHFDNLLLWYEYMEVLLDSSKSSYEVQQEFKKLEKTFLNSDEALEAFLQLCPNGFPPPPKNINAVFSFPHFFQEREFSKQLVHTFSGQLKFLRSKDTLLVMGQQDVHLSSFVGESGRLADDLRVSGKL